MMRKRILSVLVTFGALLTLLPAVSIPALAVGGSPTSTSLEVNNINGVAGQEVTLAATLTSSGSPVSGQSVSFFIDSTVVGSANTDENGVAGLSYPITVSSGDHTIEATFAGNASYYTSSGSGTLTVTADTMPPAVFSVGTRVRLVDNSVWIVLEDAGCAATRFTLVMDGLLENTFIWSEVEEMLSGFREDTRITFDDNEAIVRLPVASGAGSGTELDNLLQIQSFGDMDTYYWLSCPDDYYCWATGDGRWTRMSTSYYNDGRQAANAIRPVLTVLKSAVLIFEPFITQQPQDADLLTLAGDDAEFSVAADGDNLAYQWQVKDGESWINIAGAEEATLTIDANDEKYAIGKTFRCRLDSDWDGSVYTDEAKFIILDWQQYGRTSANAGADYTVSEDGNTVSLHTAAGLGWLASQVNSGNSFSGKTVLLDRDIDLTGRIFVPIGTGNDGEFFCGHFDGGMHTVSGMTARCVYYCGLFGRAQNALIENLLIMDGSVSVSADTSYCGGDFHVGTLCGYADETTIRNVGVGSVAVRARDDEGRYWLGGIAGYLRGETAETGLYNSFSRAVITGFMSDSSDSSAGGIVGLIQDVTVANCYFAGTIADVSSYAGGIVGFAEGSEVASCFRQVDAGILCAYYGLDESDNLIEENAGCAAVTAEHLKSADTVSVLNAWVTAGNTAEGSLVYELWGVKSTINGGYPVFKVVIPTPPPYYGGFSSRTVTETSSGIFSGSQGPVQAEANMANAFSSSVEVKVTDTDEESSGFGLGVGNQVYPFDISLYIKGTDTRTEPAPGYAVTISLPIPESLLNEKERLNVMHKSDSGVVTVLVSRLEQRNGVWYLVFEATEFSPYALVVTSAGTYDETAGLPYYTDSEGNEAFIGFAANGKYIAPSGITVRFKDNVKTFTDIGANWAKDDIVFVTEREIFLGTGSGVFSPDTGMTRAMFATVIGRLYERSYGEIEVTGDHAFTDCDYDDYYGKYVDWAAGNGVLKGYGNSRFRPGEHITREQMAVVLYRFAEFLGILPGDMDTVLNYPDADSISGYAEKAALYCQSSGIITGRDGGSFVPQGTATRAEVAVILERFINDTLG